MTYPRRLCHKEGEPIRPTTHDDLLRQLDWILFEEEVPAEVSDLFEVAKGAAALRLSLLPPVYGGSPLRHSGCRGSTFREVSAEWRRQVRSHNGPKRSNFSDTGGYYLILIARRSRW